MQLSHLRIHQRLRGQRHARTFWRHGGPTGQDWCLSSGRMVADDMRSCGRDVHAPRHCDGRPELVKAARGVLAGRFVAHSGAQRSSACDEGLRVRGIVEPANPGLAGHRHRLAGD